MKPSNKGFHFLYGFYQFEIRIFHTKTKKALEIRTFFVSTNVDVYGAGNRGRTCTLVAQDPKSCVSANSTIPAYKTKKQKIKREEFEISVQAATLRVTACGAQNC